MNLQRAFLIQQVIWIAVGFAVSLAISSILPFPYSMGAAMVVFMIMSFAIRAWAVKRIMRARASGASFPNNLLSSGPEKGLEFHCMVCGTQHRDRECPKCGSRAVRAG